MWEVFLGFERAFVRCLLLATRQCFRLVIKVWMDFEIYSHIKHASRSTLDIRRSMCWLLLHLVCENRVGTFFKSILEELSPVFSYSQPLRSPPSLVTGMEWLLNRGTCMDLLEPQVDQSFSFS